MEPLRAVMEEPVGLVPPADKTTPLLWQVAAALFPFGARTYGTVPRQSALVAMLCVLVCGLVLLVTYILAGSSCQTQVTQHTTNPRDGCIPQLLTEEEALLAFPAATLENTKPTPECQTQAPMFLTFVAPNDGRLPFNLSESCAQINDLTTSANASHSATSFSIQFLKHGAPHGRQHVFQRPNRPDLLQLQWQWRCGGEGWGIFEPTVASIVAPTFGLFVDDARVSSSSGSFDRTSLQPIWWRAITSSLPSQDVHFSASVYTKHHIYVDSSSVTNSSDMQWVIREVHPGDPFQFQHCLTRDLCTDTELLVYDAAVAIMSKTSAAQVRNLPAMRELVENMTSSSNFAWMTYSDAAAPCQRMTLQVQEGGFPVFCPQTICDGIFRRFSTGLALFMGAFGVASFCVRSLPRSHERVLSRGLFHRSKELLPLEASSIGAKPRLVAIVVYFVLQVIVVGAACYYIFLGSNCLATFRLTPTADSPTLCTHRALTRPEQATIFPALDLEVDGVVNVENTEALPWNAACPSFTPDTAVPPFALAEFVQDRNTLNSTVFAAILCTFGRFPSANVTWRNAQSGGDTLDSGVHFEWAPPQSKALQLFVPGIKHVHGQMTHSCGNNLWSVVEVMGDDGMRRTLMFTLGSALASSSILLTTTDLVDNFFFDRVLPAEKDETVIPVHFDGIQAIAPLKIFALFAGIRLQDDGTALVDLRINLENTRGVNYPLGNTVACDSATGRCTTLHMQRLVVGFLVDINLASALNNDILKQLDQAVRSASFIQMHLNETERCAHARVAMRKGNVQLWCQADECDSLPKRVSDASSVGFAALTLIMFIVRTLPGFHVTEPLLQEELRGKGRVWLTRVLPFYPTAGSPSNSRPKALLALAIPLLQVLIFAVMFEYVFTVQRCASGYDIVKGRPRAGCTKRILTTPERISVFGSLVNHRSVSLNESGNLVQCSSASNQCMGYDRPFEAVLSIEPLPVALVEGVHPLVSSLCSTHALPGLNVSVVTRGSDGILVAVTGVAAANHRIGRTFVAQSRLLGTPVQSCAGEGWAAVQLSSEDIVLLVSTARITDLNIDVGVMEDRFFQSLGTLNTTHKTKTFKVPLSDLTLNYPMIPTLLPAAVGTGGALAVSIDTRLDAPLAIGLGNCAPPCTSIPIWKVEVQLDEMLRPGTTIASAEALAQTLATIRKLSISFNVSSIKTLDLEVRDGSHVPLPCVIEVCEGLFLRLSTYAALAVSLTGVLVFTARRMTCCHEQLPFRMVRKSINVSSHILQAQGWVPRQDHSAVVGTSSSSADIQLIERHK